MYLWNTKMALRYQMHLTIFITKLKTSKMKKYEQIEGTNKELKIEVFYDKGGMNYFTSTVNRRGYYVSARVVEVKKDNDCVIESFMLFSGLKKLLFEVKRQSEKSYKEACELANNIDLSEMKQKVLSAEFKIK